MRLKSPRSFWKGAQKPLRWDPEHSLLNLKTGKQKEGNKGETEAPVVQIRQHRLQWVCCQRASMWWMCCGGDCKSTRMSLLVWGFASSSKTPEGRASRVGHEKNWLKCVTVIVIVTAIVLIPGELPPVLEPNSLHAQAHWSVHPACVYCSCSVCKTRPINC